MLQSLILVDVPFPLDGGKRREGKKKGKRNLHWGGGFTGVGPTLLTVLWVAAVKCN
jgi:hypothetical protein